MIDGCTPVVQCADAVYSAGGKKWSPRGCPGMFHGFSGLSRHTLRSTPFHEIIAQGDHLTTRRIDNLSFNWSRICLSQAHGHIAMTEEIDLRSCFFLFFFCNRKAPLYLPLILLFAEFANPLQQEDLGGSSFLRRILRCVAGFPPSSPRPKRSTAASGISVTSVSTKQRAHYRYVIPGTL